MTEAASDIEVRVNRQQDWATRACAALRDAYVPDCPPLLLTYGWPRGYRGNYKRAQAIAVYHRAQTEADGVIFIIPTAWTHPNIVICSLLVEMIRAAEGGMSADSKRVKRRAESIGIDSGTARTLNADAAAALDQLAEMLGEFPAAAMPEIKSKGGGRLKRHACAGCGKIAYTSREISELECSGCRLTGAPYHYKPAPFRGQED